jgi:hypothetical protein
MKYNTIEDHDEIFVIPENYNSDRPLFVGITSLGFHGEGYDARVKWAYTFAYGPYDADIQLQGDDLGSPSEDSEAAVTALLGFYGAYADGEMVEPPDADPYLVSDGDVKATGATAQFIVANGERFSIVESELENGYVAWGEPHYVDYGYMFELSVRETYSTGKEDE